MKKTLPFLFFTLYPFIAESQQKNEIKIDFLALLEPMGQVSYEHIWVKTGFSLEAVLNYNWQNPEVLLTLGQVPVESEFEIETIGLLLDARYYFQRYKQDQGFFGGVFYFNEFKIESDPEYPKFYQTTYGEPAFDPQWRRSSIGILTGYKWLVREQLVIEPLAGIGYNLLPLFDRRRRSDTLTFINVNIGYRF